MRRIGLSLCKESGECFARGERVEAVHGEYALELVANAWLIKATKPLGHRTDSIAGRKRGWRML